MVYENIFGSTHAIEMNKFCNMYGCTYYINGTTALECAMSRDRQGIIGQERERKSEHGNNENDVFAPNTKRTNKIDNNNNMKYHS